MTKTSLRAYSNTPLREPLRPFADTCFALVRREFGDGGTQVALPDEGVGG